MYLYWFVYLYLFLILRLTLILIRIRTLIHIIIFVLVIILILVLLFEFIFICIITFTFTIVYVHNLFQPFRLLTVSLSVFKFDRALNGSWRNFAFDDPQRQRSQSKSQEIRTIVRMRASRTRENKMLTSLIDIFCLNFKIYYMLYIISYRIIPYHNIA